MNRCLLSVVFVLSVVVVFPSCSPSEADPHGHDNDAKARGHSEDEKRSSGEAHAIQLAVESLSRIGIQTTAVKMTSLPTELRTSGKVDFNRDALVHVSPRLPGRVVDVHKSLGDEVKPGDWLVSLDSIELGKAKADYLKAKAIEDVSRLALKREEALFQDKISSERELLEAKGKALEAKSQLNAAQEILLLYGLTKQTIRGLHFGDANASRVPMRAPGKGRIVNKHVTRGEMVSPERVLFTIADLSDVWVWIDLFEKDLPLVHLGDDVTVRSASVPGASFRGKIAYIKDEVDVDTRAVRARIDVINTSRALKPGMFVDVVVSDPHAKDSRDPAPKRMAIPNSAIVTEGPKSFVFVKTGPGLFQRRGVRLGNQAGGLVEVQSGLALNEEVVSAGTFILKSELRKEALGESEHSH